MSRKKKKENPGKEMALSGHLKELRNRLVVCGICLIAAFLVCLNFAPDIVELLTDLGKGYGYRYVYIAPQELMMQHFSLALLAALCVTFPLIAYQIWAFIRPGLEKRENALVLLAAFFGLLCFITGVLFAYYIMLPFMLQFLISVGAGSDITAAITVENYISFLLTMFVIFGLVFELPVLAVLLTQLGVVKVSWMKKGTRVMIVIIFFLSAVITPPDVISQIMVAVPMIGLYELSILVSSLLLKLRRKKKAEAGEDEEEADEETEEDEEDREEKE